MLNQRPNDLIRVSEARKLLGVSPTKMSKMLRDGVIRYFPDPLDNRVKLVSESDVYALLQMRGKAA